MKIHKIEAAQRQLDTAISLFFSNGEPCAVIALAAAAEEILGSYVDGAWAKDNPDSMFGRMWDEATRRGLSFKDKREFSRRLVNVTRNSLKHANIEDEQYVTVDDEEMVIRLMQAVASFQTGSGRRFSDLMTKFELWLKQNRSHYLGPS